MFNRIKKTLILINKTNSKLIHRAHDFCVKKIVYPSFIIIMTLTYIFTMIVCYTNNITDIEQVVQGSFVISFIPYAGLLAFNVLMWTTQIILLIVKKIK